MAILNLTPQLAERGKIKIGGLGEERKKKGSNETYLPPEKYDHLIITTIDRDAAGRLIADEELMRYFAQENGPTISKGPYKGLPLLKEIKVRLLYDDIDINFPAYYANYHGKRCWCSGNGKTAQRLDAGGKYQPVSCPCERQDPLYEDKNDRCSIMGTLQVLVEGSNHIGGVWKYRSKGWNTVNAILSSLTLIKTITGGPLAGIPLTLVVSPKPGRIPGTGESVLIHMVSIEYRGTGKYPVKQIGVDDDSGEPTYIGGVQQELEEWGCKIAQRRLQNRFRLEQIEEEARKMLLAPHEESPEEQALTGAEYFPSSVTDLGDQSSGSDKEGIDKKLAVVPEGAEKEAPPSQSVGAPGESLAVASSEAQAAEVEAPKPMTFLEVIAACRTNTFILAFPIPLVTTKGVAIGEWVDRRPGQEGDTNVILEMVPDFTATTKLTKEQIVSSFKKVECGVIFQEPGTMKQEALTRGEAVIPPAEQLPENQPGGNGGEPMRLF